MPSDQYIPLISALIAFAGLMLVVLQLRDSRKQRETESLNNVMDINRQLLTLGFSHPQLFKILEDDKKADPVWERYYLQMWLNQFSLIHSYLKNSVLTGERKENLTRDVSDFLAMANVQKHWKHFGKFYPESFQDYVNQILKKNEPHKAAHVTAE